MKIIISPAKKMRTDRDVFPPETLPVFLPDAERLLHRLRALSEPQLKALWRCNDSIARLNCERVRTMDLRGGLTPAILAFVGIQYQYMAPGVFEDRQFAYIRAHLRILSGFYGLLRPFDGVAPYRLEMQARLSLGGCRDLYEFWNRRLADRLCAETDWVLNLASLEYSRAVSAHLPQGFRFLSCIFAEWEDGRLVEKGTLCKMARGEMVRWLAEHEITAPEEIKEFDRLGYRYLPEQSGRDRLVFCREGEKPKNSSGRR